MARNKHPELTEARIVEAATRLFLERGYRNTSVQDIVDELGGLTRGAFYHHFKGKEDVFDAVTTKLFYADNPIAAGLERKERQGLSGLETLRAVVMHSIRGTLQSRMIRSAPEFFRSDKYLATHLRESVEVIAPMLVPIIEAGMTDGSIACRSAKQAAEGLILLLNMWLSPVIFERDEAEYRLRCACAGDMLRGGGIDLVDDEMLDAMLGYYRQSNRPHDQEGSH